VGGIIITFFCCKNDQERKNTFWQLFSSYVLAKKHFCTKNAHKMLMKLTPTINFTRNFFVQISALSSSSLVTFWLYNFLAQKAQVKCL